MDQGRLIIVGRPDLREEYLAEIVQTKRQLTGDGLDPIVRILAVLRYPRQAAIYFSTIPMEIPPVPGGTICRLPFLRDATEEEAARYHSYDESLAAAKRIYLQQCQSAEERELCLNGQPHVRRSLVTFSDMYL